MVSPEWEFAQPRPARLDLWGRITEYGTPVRDSPGGNVIGFLPLNHVLPLFEVIRAPGPPSNPRNDIWYRVQDGYIYTAGVQPITPYHMPTEITTIDTQINDQPGFWAEVTVPHTAPRDAPSGVPTVTDSGEGMGLTFASVHRVVEVATDEADNLWYQVADDKRGARPFYVLARHVRRIPLEEFAPISPGVDKRIVITLEEQRIDCYEGDRLVFTTLTSTGASGFETPRGEWWVVLKQPSRHMYSDPEQEAFSDPNFFDLPGVPFVIFFTTLGHAIHGTYWHGDYGRPRSHGCPNVSPEAARWMYRWVEPVAPYESDFVSGTRVTGTAVFVV